jgi:chemotaxis protein MotA
MNRSLTFGFLMVNAVFITTIYLALGSVTSIYDLHSLIIVLGGTVAVSIFSFSFTDMKKVAIGIYEIILNKNKDDKLAVIEDILNLAKAKRRSEKDFMNFRQEVKDPFLKDAARLLFWAESETSAEDFKNLLKIKSESYVDEHLKAPLILKSLAKFPPAFGLMGTVLGIMAMMSKLSDPNAKSQIGPAMAVALMATLYGISLNNIFIIPMSESLMQMGKIRAHTYDLIIEGIMMLHEKKPINYMKEKLNSFLGVQLKENE